MKQIKNFWSVYYNYAEISFFVFFFGVFSFGRVFSLIHFNIFSFPLYINEIFLLLNIPVLVYKRRELARLPRVFLGGFLSFFILGCVYLAWGIFRGNIFALRDITLSLYLLFFPISYIYLSKSLEKIKILIGIILAGNLINLCLGRFFLMHAYPSQEFRDMLGEVKLFNLGLYYGIACSFLVSFYDGIKNKLYRFFALLILTLNVFILITSSKTSIWIASLSLALFLPFQLKGRFLKLVLVFLPFFLIFSSLIIYLDFMTTQAHYKKIVYRKAKSLSLFVSGTRYRYEYGNPYLTNKQNQISRIEEPEAHGKIDAGASEEKAKQAAEAGDNQVRVLETDQKKEQAKERAKQDLSVIKMKKESTEEYLGNITWRLNIWKQTLKFCKDSPFFGKGFGRYPVYEIWGTHQYPKDIKANSKIVPVHNHLLTVFFKMGALGLGIFLFLNIYVFRLVLSQIKMTERFFLKNFLVASAGAFVFWHTLALSFDVIDSPPTSILLWLIIAMIFSGIAAANRSV